VNVNEVSGVSGFILPGDRVDVLVTINNIDRPGNSVTKMILQNLEVLAAGVQTTTKNDKPVEVQSVTLLLEPKGAEDLALALYQGRSIRPPQPGGQDVRVRP
jgi:pilus assembly protein CpaB